MRAILISVGDELALGQTVDTNTAYLAAQLALRGVMACRHETVPDDRAAIAAAVRRAAAEGDLVIVTGGLGPTADDLTREALADALGVPLIEHAESLRRIEAFFAGRNRPMPQRNRVQAMLPQGAEPLDNTCGTAPGIAARLTEARLFILPGVPREMQAMFEHRVAPTLPNGRQIHVATLHTFGQGESTVAQRLGELMERGREPTIGTTVSDGICSVRVRAADAAALENAVLKVRQRLGAVIFGRDGQTLAEALVALLRDRGLTVATAESCTGGLIGKLVTDVPGASAVYRGGWITYTNDLKRAQLGVRPEVLAHEGAVSAATVRAMARGAAERADADCAVAVSGIAGPDGGSSDKPVGTVWIGLHLPDEHRAVACRFIGDRAQVRDRAAKMAMQLLRLRLLGEAIETLDWLTPAREHAVA